MALASSRSAIPSGRLPVLPIIEHPASRLPSQGDLSVSGNSRTTSRNYKNSLPALHQGKQGEKTRNHSRGQTWPFGHEKALDLERNSLQSFVQSKSVDELEELIREKLTAGFYGIRQAFRANDPQRKGNVSREAFTTILYHLCGYVPAVQVSGFLKRLGLEAQSSISYDDFISHFKDTEIVQKEWMDPVLRPIQGVSDLPANRLREKQRRQQQETKNQPGTFYTALQVFPLLKRKAKEGHVVARLLPSLRKDLDGMILKPQLRQALFSLGIGMYEDEFDKVWDRIDRNGTGAVDSRTFFRVLGLGHDDQEPENTKRPPVTVRVPELPDELVEQVTKQDEPVIPAVEQKEREARSEPREDISDVMSMLSNKFKQGYHDVLSKFTKYDSDDSGKISKSDFRHALASLRLTLGPLETEHFLSRFGVRQQELVPYREILDTCQDRTERGLLQRVMEDSKHRFNKSRDSQLGSTTAMDAEARLLDLLHADFLSLLGAFRQLDRENIGVVKKYQFKELLEARLQIKLTTEQLTMLRQRTGDDPTSGLVSYPRFLEAFSCVSKHKSLKDSPRTQTANSQRPSTCPTHPPSVQSASPKKLDRSATQTDLKKESRDVDELLSNMGALITDKYDVIRKTFMGIDKTSRNCGNLTRETFRKLFERHNMAFTADEVDSLWKKLPAERDGTLNFVELVKSCFTAVNRTPPTQTERKVGHLSRVLQDYARAHVRKTLEKFLEEEEDQNEGDLVPSEACALEPSAIEPRDQAFPPIRSEKPERPKLDSTINKIKFEVRTRWNQIRDDLRKFDSRNTGTVNLNDFKRVLLEYCKSLTDIEADVVAAKFDKNKENTVPYLEFLKHFLPTMPEGTNPVLSPRKAKPVERQTPSTTAVVNIMNKIRNKMICEWKTLRRSMKRYDVTGDGVISIEDFRSTMLAFDFRLDEEDFYHIYSAFDVNMDGKISYVEFMKKALD